MKLFLSYSFKDELFVREVHYCLKKQPKLGTFFWSSHGQGDDFRDEIEEQINDSDVLVIFAGESAGETQRKEIAFFETLCKTEPTRRTLVAQLAPALPKGLKLATALSDPIPVDRSYSENAAGARRAATKCAKSIVERLGLTFVPDDGIPVDYPFAYEKDIIEEYIKGKGHPSSEKVAQGCPSSWPSVECQQPWYDNPLDPHKVGSFKDDSARIIVDTRPPTSDSSSLTLLEARPRLRLRYPRQAAVPRLGVGIIVSGGIAPGINAVIDGIVKRHTLYAHASEANGFSYRLKIQGFAEGFKGFFHAGVKSRELDVSLVEQHAEHGGSMLGTSRTEELVGSAPGDPWSAHGNFEKIVTRLCGDPNDRVHILYVIGGDGSMRASHALQRTANDMGKDLAVIGIPKTMDNDILWVWQSFGFLSAVEKAREVILNMRTEVASNPRLGIIQLFGSDSGFVASHAAYSTACDLVLIPEDPLTMDQISRHVTKRLKERLDGQTSPFGLVVMAETALPADAGDYIDDPLVHLSDPQKDAVKAFLAQGRRVTGQTPDELRTAALKMISRLLQKRIRGLELPHPQGAEPGAPIGGYWSQYHVVTNEPKQLIRSIRPSVSDVIFGERLGTLAVDNAMAGYRDFVVSQWLTEFVLVPMDLVVLGRKRVPINGIFWKSVRAKTGQPTGTQS